MARNWRAKCPFHVFIRISINGFSESLIWAYLWYLWHALIYFLDIVPLPYLTYILNLTYDSSLIWLYVWKSSLDKKVRVFFVINFKVLFIFCWAGTITGAWIKYLLIVITPWYERTNYYLDHYIKCSNLIYDLRSKI